MDLIVKVCPHGQGEGGQAKVDTYRQGQRGKSKCVKNVWTSFMDGPMPGTVQEQDFHTNKVHKLELFA